MLEIKNISVTVGGGSKLERRLIKNLNLTVESGEFVVLIGGNGAGKTTLFNAISGSLPLESGSIWIEGADISVWPS